jgi:hypothetical protein
VAGRAQEAAGLPPDGQVGLVALGVGEGPPLGSVRAGRARPLSRFSYTPEKWARLIASPEDRRTAAQSYIESVGGKLHGFWYAFGTHDGDNLWEAPRVVAATKAPRR